MITGSPALAETRTCAGCAVEIPSRVLACPSCGKLVHSEMLKVLAGEGELAERERNTSRALASWRRVLELLPPESLQYQRVLEKIKILSAAVTGSPASGSPPSGQALTTGSRPGAYKWLAGLGAIGALLAKFKWGILFLLGKGKLILAGLLEAKTVLSMVLALGVYATALGWKFALGLVVSIYIHEMGHVVWLRRYGIAATAPMFVPGLGAFVRLKQRLATAGEDARVGLAGPVWGAAAAVASGALGLLFASSIFVAIGAFGAWINLFNLLPVWQLDGGRGFAALSRRERGVAAAALWALVLLRSDFMLWLLAIAATLRAVGKSSAPATGDRPILITYVALALGLALIVVGASAYLARHPVAG